MKILGHIKINKLFSAFESNGGYFRGTKCGDYYNALYYCANCASSFDVNWRYLGPIRGFGGSEVICPCCGSKHSRKYTRYATRYLRENESAPLSMNVDVVEYKNHVSLHIFMPTVRFSELHHAIAENTEEIFKFDVKSRKTTWTQKVDRRLKEELELGDPFDLQVMRKSLLRFLNPDSCDRPQRKDLNLLLGTLRKAVQTKLEKVCGHKTKSFYICGGGYPGHLLAPVFNIAYRMVFLDAPNLPAPYRGSKTKIFWDTRMLYQPDMDQFADLQFFRKSTNCILALIEKYGLPNVPSIRKILQSDFFAVRVLAFLAGIDTGINFITAGYPLVLAREWPAGLHNAETAGTFRNFCLMLKENYGSSTVLRFMEKMGDSNWGNTAYDTYRMYCQLTPGNKALARSVKYRGLHDWLAQKISEQETIGYDFNVPEAIKKRLMMQKDSIRFYLPDHSGQLKQAGNLMHNCVASYSDRMLQNNLQIVLVSDGKGKLVACLEIQGNNLVQAKLKCNRPVCDDEKINAEILEWAQKVKIRVDRCGDVQTEPAKVHLPAVIPAAV